MRANPGTPTRAAVLWPCKGDLCIETLPDPVWEPDGVVLRVLVCGTCLDCAAGKSQSCKARRLPGFTEPGDFAEFVAVPFAHNLARLPDSPPARQPVARGGAGAEMAGDDGPARADSPRRIATCGGTGDTWHGRERVVVPDPDPGPGPGPGARVVVVDVMPEKLAHALSPGAEAAIDARDRDLAARIVEPVQGIAATANGSIDCLPPRWAAKCRSACP